jgi:hypothetical protein
LLSFFAKQVSSRVECDEEPSVKGPVVHRSVTPQSSDAPARGQAPAPQWKPGEPVRVSPDLKESPQPGEEEVGKPPVETPRKDD